MGSWQSERASVAVNVRHHGEDSEQAAEARRRFRLARAEWRIQELAQSDLTAEQRTLLAVQLLQSTGSAA